MRAALSIPGLDVSLAIEQELACAFSEWSPHFLCRLQNEGIEFLFARYVAVVESIETCSCNHGSGGTRRTGTAWQECCGISYEYINDISVRDAIEIILTTLPKDSEPSFRSRISNLDARLYSFYEHCPPIAGKWWHQGLPRGIVE